MASRARGFAFVVYPESAPENWRDILDNEHIAWCESPLHEFDVNPDGEIKKPHWHVVLSFEGVKTLDQVKKIIEPLNCTIPIVLNSIRGMVRYMAHLDNPEKYQYNPALIVSHGGMDVSDLLRLSASARYHVLKEMCQYAASHNISYFSDLVDYVINNRYEDWFPVLADSNAYLVMTYVKELRQKDKDLLRELKEAGRG